MRHGRSTKRSWSVRANAGRSLLQTSCVPLAPGLADLEPRWPSTESRLRRCRWCGRTRDRAEAHGGRSASANAEQHTLGADLAFDGRYGLPEGFEVSDQLADLLVGNDPAPVRHARDRRLADYAAAADDVGDRPVGGEVVAESLAGERRNRLVRRRRVRHASEAVRAVAVDAAVADVEGRARDGCALAHGYRSGLRVGNGRQTAANVDD